jgi:hypothetical protein
VVKIELQVVADCPHEAPTAQLLRRALDDVGLSTTRFTTVVVTGHEHAEQLRFTGSPTIRIDGVDPFADPAWQPQLACRVYRTATGLSRTPDLAALRRFLKQAADQGVVGGPPVTKDR